MPSSDSSQLDLAFYPELSGCLEDDSFKSLSTVLHRLTYREDYVHAIKSLLHKYFAQPVNDDDIDLEDSRFYRYSVSSFIRQTNLLFSSTINKPLLKLSCDPLLLNYHRRKTGKFMGESDGCLYTVEKSTGRDSVDLNLLTPNSNCTFHLSAAEAEFFANAKSTDANKVKSSIRIYMPPSPTKGRPEPRTVKLTVNFPVAAVLVNAAWNRVAIIVRRDKYMHYAHIYDPSSLQLLQSIPLGEWHESQFVKQAEYRGNYLAMSIYDVDLKKVHIIFLDVDHQNGKQTILDCEHRSDYAFQFISAHSVLVCKANRDINLLDLQTRNQTRIQSPLPAYEDTFPCFVDFVPNMAPCARDHTNRSELFSPKPDENLVGLRLVWTRAQHVEFLFTSISSFLRAGIYHKYNLKSASHASPKLFGRRLVWVEQREQGPVIHQQAGLNTELLPQMTLWRGRSCGPQQNGAVAPQWQKSVLKRDERTLSLHTMLMPKAQIESDLGKYQVLNIQVTGDCIGLLVMRIRSVQPAWGIQYLCF